MVIAVRAVLVALVEFLGVLAEALLALFAGEYHFEALEEFVLFLFAVAFGAVEPFPTCVVMLVRDVELRERGGAQHGDRMETWALRMCLLWVLVVSNLGGNGCVVRTTC